MKNINFENIKESLVLLRCDFNEPIRNGICVATKRIDANVLTIHELLSRRNKVILLSHHSNDGQTLEPVANYLKQTFHHLEYVKSLDTEYITSFVNENKKKGTLPSVVLLENTRLFRRGMEEKLDELADPEFTNFLAGLADYFVFDAFSVGHRKHSSTVGLAKLLPSCLGLTCLKEKNVLTRLVSEEKDSLMIIGGAKLSTKLPIINSLMNSGGKIAIGGAMLHPILKARGVDIRKSLNEELNVDALKENKNIILPRDYVWDKSKENIVDNIFDIAKLEEIVVGNGIKNIFWNGPVGLYEAGNERGSHELAEFIRNKTGNIFTVIGGGDTDAFLEKVYGADFDKYYSYISLSGGAMLEYLSKKTLPILEIIKE